MWAYKQNEFFLEFNKFEYKLVLPFMVKYELIYRK